MCIFSIIVTLNGEKVFKHVTLFGKVQYIPAKSKATF